jgi:hypothetical protein
MMTCRQAFAPLADHRYLGEEKSDATPKTSPTRPRIRKPHLPTGSHPSDRRGPKMARFQRKERLDKGRAKTTNAPNHTMTKMLTAIWAAATATRDMG